MLSRYISLVVPVLMILLLAFKSEAVVPPTIRVLVLEGIPEVNVYSGAGLAIRGLGANISPWPVITKNAVVGLGNSGIEVGGRPVKSNSVTVSPAGGGLLWVNGKSYPGEIIISNPLEGGLIVVNALPMEEYIRGILQGEMPDTWPLEALKAQAVAARTYAIYLANGRKNKGSQAAFDLKSTVEDQVYNGYAPQNASVVDAVEGTRGEILIYNGEPLQARFHSTCGGETEISLNVWGEKDAGKSIRDPYCKRSPYMKWHAIFGSAEIESKLRSQGLGTGAIDSIRVEKFEKGGRVAAVSIHGNEQTISLTGNDFRRYLGFDRIKSTKFTVKKEGARFRFTGSGFGHGVGMCQWGAKAMAEMGSSYRDILNFYYPGTEIKKRY